MRTDIRISAVIATYNRERTIAIAIDSVLAQEHPASEIIVVDDGSSDNTWQIVHTYGERVRYVYQPNAGVCAARNRGVNEARYEWIAFLDSDDYWLPNHLTRMLNAIAATHGEAALYFSDIQLPPAQGGYFLWDLCGFKIGEPIEFRRDAGEWALMQTQPIILQSSVIRKRTYWDIGGSPEHLPIRGETLVIFKLALHYPACAVSGCGTIMTSADNIRLTQIHHRESLTFWNSTILLHREVLASASSVSRERRQILIASLCGSYFSLGRILFRRANYLSSLKNLCISCFISPSVFTETFWGSLERRVLKMKKRIGPSPRLG